MAREPVLWDTFKPDAGSPQQTPTSKPAPTRQQLEWGAKHAPGPALLECDECGDAANPCWSDGTCNFCRRCVPDELRNPTRNP